MLGGVNYFLLDNKLTISAINAISHKLNVHLITFDYLQIPIIVIMGGYKRDS